MSFSSKLDLSIVIPIYNEEDNISPMVEAIKNAITNLKYEIVFVDDGSSDSSVEKINSLKEGNIKLVKFTRNFGQTSAMAAGIEYAEGEYLAFLDGDLQNDPTDIPIMLEKLKSEGLDMVAGRRAKRKDGLLLRKIPSKIANKLIYGMSKLEISDYGCTLKIMKTELAKSLDLYGELHRFIPILASLKGAKIAQIDVKHHPRKFGVSKYGLSRTLRVASDLLLMGFFIKYRQKPMHLFGSLGLISLGGGSLIEFYLLILKILGEDIGGRPLFFIGILLLIAGVQLITTGFIAELLMRTYYKSADTTPYRVLSVKKISGYE
ncbi:MAG: glycosyltransferase family 2 protein [Rickettsiales bacterium]|nr:glycosyltransferase family 2 protein [Rickettsiales bacterium]